MPEMDYNILFRWFVGLDLEDPVDGVHEEPRPVAGGEGGSGNFWRGW
jgi:hypothetical protein